MYSQWQVANRILKLICLGYQAPVQLSKPRSTLPFIRSCCIFTKIVQSRVIYIGNMKAQLEKYGDKGFEVVGISLDNTPEECEAFVTQNELPWINLISPKESERGWDNPLANYYGISGIPAAFLLDKEGKVVSMNAIGPELNRLLAEMLEPVDGSAE